MHFIIREDTKEEQSRKLVLPKLHRDNAGKRLCDVCQVNQACGSGQRTWHLTQL